MSPTMSSPSQPQKGVVPTPHSAIDDPLAKDLMSPTYRTRSGSGSASAPSSATTATATADGGSPTSAARGMSNTSQWRPALDRKMSFDPQELKHSQQQQQDYHQPAADASAAGFTEKA